ncbi:MAG: 1-deoxy-D-xylulose-5-phosphate synthase [Clostridia bacterium]|nr:1-deoxy-D-xylulose-5-phosphate synthase [Clostridia bacterium]
MYCISDVKKMNIAQLNDAAREIREELVRATDQNGGHLASNLGTVELTLALHCVFDSPRDKMVFDVGHQAYTHKLLTGRSLEGMRHANGVSGFPDFNESEHDPFIVGHSATAVSTALGLARARDIKDEDFHIIAVVGDGAFGGGMNLEAVNDLGFNPTRLIIVLNDNGMSISRNVGALSRHMLKLRTAKGYVGFKKGMERFLKGLPCGNFIFKAALNVKNFFRRMLIGTTVFDNMGIKFIGSVDGHNIPELKNILQRAKEETVPVLVQIRTLKGKGAEKAENDPVAYHGVASALANGKKEKTFTKSFGAFLTDMARENEKICAITAGMTDSTGLRAFADAHHDRFFDVGIAEQHAFGLAAGLAKGGMRPVVAIYSTFLQRGADQIFHDIALQRLPVVMCIDRAGFVGQDGQTHQGAYDIAILRAQGIKIMAPADPYQLKQMLNYAFTLDVPCAIRYPKGGGCCLPQCELVPDRWQSVKKGEDCIIVTFGALLSQALEAAGLLEAEGISVEVVNACFLAPDAQYIKDITANSLFVLEDNAYAGGLAEAIAGLVQNNESIKHFASVSGEAGFNIHDDVFAQLKAAGLDAASIAELVKNTVRT